MIETNPYQAYADETILNGSPLALVVALYEGAIESSANARKYLAAGDIPARTKAITKLNNILAELMRSLDDEKGGKLSSTLRGLYVYLQKRVIDAHFQKNPAPLVEVEKLLTILLEGWRVAKAKCDSTPLVTHPTNEMNGSLSTPSGPMRAPAEFQQDYGYHDTALSYSSYLSETTAAF
jgi:flagellar protein FliS